MRGRHHDSRFEGILKMKLQASDASAPEGLQSQNLSRPENRLSVNGLAIVHGRLRTAAKSRVLGPVNLPRTSLGRRRQLKAGIGQSNLIFEIGPYRRKRVRPQTGDKG